MIFEIVFFGVMVAGFAIVLISSIIDEMRGKTKDE